MYMPYDVPGFGINRTPPTHSITPDLALLNVAYSSVHVNHFPSTLPRTIVARALNLSVSIWGVTSGVFAIFALLGLFTLAGPTLFAVSSALVLFATYLLYATTGVVDPLLPRKYPRVDISHGQREWRGRLRWPDVLEASRGRRRSTGDRPAGRGHSWPAHWSSLWRVWVR
jgi:hypothetical protein